MNKTSGGDGIPAELFQILKDDAVKSVALNMPPNLEDSAVAKGLEKVRFHFNSKERQCQRMFKLPYNSFPILVGLCSKSFKLSFSSR